MAKKKQSPASPIEEPHRSWACATVERAIFWLHTHSHMVACCELFVHALSTAITHFKMYKLFTNKVLCRFLSYLVTLVHLLLYNK